MARTLGQKIMCVREKGTKNCQLVSLKKISKQEQNWTKFAFEFLRSPIVLKQGAHFVFR